MEISDLLKVLELVNGEKKQKKKSILDRFVGQKVIIRDHSAGVFITTLEAVDGREWVGGESRKIHYWDKAGAVEGIAETSIDLDRSRITVETASSCGTQLTQICPVSDCIYNQIMRAKVWNPK